MKDIFDRQMQLNIYTLGNSGLDFSTTIADPEQKVVWIENYRKAFSAELAELVREVRELGIGTHNGKIEVVDLLHFLVSLSQIVGVTPEQASAMMSPANPGRTRTSDARRDEAFPVCVVGTFLALDDLQGSMKWKWWAKGGGFKPDKAREAVLDLWKRFGEICSLFELDFESMKRIYIAKNEVNFKRQDRHYNEDTKDESDNLAIEA
jgi:hypothetical protein